MTHVNEKHLSNVTRTVTQSPVEIMLMIIPSVYATFASVLLTSFFMNMKERCHKNGSLYSRFFLDIILIVLPLILDLTVLADDEKYLQHVVFVAIGYLAYLISRSKCMFSQDLTSYKPTYFVTNMRATINLITVAAILAVDFVKVFPARFHKTLNYGFSLMDVGVGLYVFSNGIVAPELNKPVNSLLKSMTGSMPIIFLGLVRLLLVTLTSYHVNVTEYGKHWNFFFTLAITKVLSSIILNFISINHSMLIGVVVLFIHEFSLQIGLAAWVLDKKITRNTFITANREGIVSSLGYVGLYFLSISMGKLINSRYNKSNDYFKLSIFLGLYSFLFFYITFIFDKYFGVSRCLASTGYCSWIIFIGIFMGLLFLFVEIALMKIYKFFSIKNGIFVPLIFEAINYNGLLFFLLANILTGFLNITVITHFESKQKALFILFLYMIINCGVVTLLYKKNIKITALMNVSLNRQR